MVVLKPLVVVRYTPSRKWDKPMHVECRELEEAVEKARKEKTPYEEAILVKISDSKTFANAALVFWNPKTKKVYVHLLYTLFYCEVA